MFLWTKKIWVKIRIFSTKNTTLGIKGLQRPKNAKARTLRKRHDEAMRICCFGCFTSCGPWVEHKVFTTENHGYAISDTCQKTAGVLDLPIFPPLFINLGPENNDVHQPLILSLKKKNKAFDIPLHYTILTPLFMLPSFPIHRDNMNPCWAPKLVPITFCYPFWRLGSHTHQFRDCIHGQRWMEAQAWPMSADIGDSFAQFSMILVSSASSSLPNSSILGKLSPLFTNQFSFWHLKSVPSGNLT